eukprot:12413164-Karenia_brevis.AAC.1
MTKSREEKVKGEDKGGYRRNILEEKSFWHMEKFGRDVVKYRGWMFDLRTALGQADKGLAEEVAKIIQKDDDKKLPEEPDPSKDPKVSSK